MWQSKDVLLVHVEIVLTRPKWQEYISFRA